mgnify:CR=1 FL=1
MTSWVSITNRFYYGFRPMTLVVDVPKILVNGLVNRSTKFLLVLTYTTLKIPLSIICLTNLYRSPTCFGFPLYTPLYTLDNVASVSQYMGIEGIGISHRRISISRSRIHSASLPAAAKAISSASIVE